MLQVLLGQCPELDPEACQKYRPLQTCVVGQIFDSSPIDFVSEIGVRFLSHPPGGQQSTARFLAAKSTAVILDGLFKGRFEADRRDFWQTLERAAVRPSAHMLGYFFHDGKLWDLFWITFVRRLKRGYPEILAAASVPRVESNTCFERQCTASALGSWEATLVGIRLGFIGGNSRLCKAGSGWQ